MVQTDEERKAKQREYSRKYRTNNQEKIKKIKQEYRNQPEVKEHEKKQQQKYNSRPEVKERLKEWGIEYRSKTSVKEHRKKYVKKYDSRPEIKKEHNLKQKKLYHSSSKIRDSKSKGKKIQLQNLKLEVFLVYSKRFSDSKKSCCRCCGEDLDIIFLTIDHIEGREHLSKTEKELSGGQLYRWLKRNDYPNGYQVLCWNCNSAKGMLGICPHETIRKEETFAMMEEQSSFEV